LSPDFVCRRTTRDRETWRRTGEQPVGRRRLVDERGEKQIRDAERGDAVILQARRHPASPEYSTPSLPTIDEITPALDEMPSSSGVLRAISTSWSNCGLKFALKVS
jgi:hypothetical protein